MVDVGPCYTSSAGGSNTNTPAGGMSCAATRIVKVVHDSRFGDNKCGRDSVDLRA